MTIDSGLRDIMLGATPNLRAFAISLTSNVDRRTTSSRRR